MPTLIRCEIDGVDRSAYLVGIEGLAPAGYGEVGTATLIFKRDATLAYSLQDKQRVEVGLHDGTNWVHREFGGWISDIDIQNTVPAEFLAVGCQDHNLILDVLVSQPLVDLFFSGGVDFDDMVQAVVTAYNGAAAKQIDATSQVANLITTPTMPDVHIPGDTSLREALQLVMDAAQVANPALRPRFFLGNDNIATPLFDNAVLYVYDAALVPTVSFRFSDNPGIGQKPIYGEFKIKDDGTSMRNRRWLTWREDAAVLGEDTTSKGLYPSPYSPHNAWMGKAITNMELPDVATAQATIDGLVYESAYFRRTIQFSTVERVLPGMVVGVSWAKEGLVDVGYYVVGSDIDYSDPLEPMRLLTLNAAVLEFGERAGKGAGGLSIPHTPPTPPVQNAPTPLNADGSYGSYDGGTGLTSVQLNWTHSISPQVVDYLADVTWNGSTVRIPTGYVTSHVLELPPDTAFSVVLWAFNMWGQISPVSSGAQSGTTQRAPAAMIPNGSFELGVRFHPEWPFDWKRTNAGSSLATRTSGQAYDQSHSGQLAVVGGAPCSFTSPRMAVDYQHSYMLTYWIMGDVAASYCRVDVLQYGPGDTPTLLATKTRTDVVPTPDWARMTMPLSFPLNTTQIEVKFTNTHGGTATLWVDAVACVRQIINDDVAEHGLPPSKMVLDIAPSLYNGDFTIVSESDPTQADGWTFLPAGAGTGARVAAASVGASIGGKYVYEITLPASLGEGGTITSSKISMVDSTDSAINAGYAKYFRCILQSPAAHGTYSINVDFYDAADVNINTQAIDAGSLSAGYIIADGNFVQAGASYAVVSIYIGSDGTANTAWIGGGFGGDAVITDMIKLGAVTGTKIAALAVNSSKLAANSVIAGKIATGGISASTQFAAGVVNSAALGTGAVTAGKIGTGGISAAGQFAAGVVDNAALGAGSVTNAKLGTITDSSKFQFDAMTNLLRFYDDTAVERGNIAVDRTLNFFRIQSNPTNNTELRLETANPKITLHDDATAANRYIQYQTNNVAAPHLFLGGGVVFHNDGALATTDIKGMVHLPYMAGVPSNLPTLYTGGVPALWDDTNFQLYVYSRSASAWKKSAIFT